MVGVNEIEIFKRDGVVCLRRVFSDDWLALVRSGIDKDLADLGPLHTIQQPEGEPGYFVTDFCMAQRIEEFRNFVLDSPAGEIIAKLLRSEKCNFFYDALWAKGPGTPKRTRWHQDQPYYPIDGEQVAIMWLPIDSVTAETSLECIRGSHRWGRWFQPELSRDGSMLFGGGERSYEKMPDINGHRGDYDIVSFDMSPRDCIVFTGLTVHGAPGNSSDRQPRRALSTVWMGDDAVFGTRPGKVRPSFEGHGLRPGDSMDCDYFPRVWPRASDASSWAARFGTASRFRASI
jgi:ectoine hydroxylase-related dioxygenase (phytanoyl-CoA dioxygenase family)